MACFVIGCLHLFVLLVGFGISVGCRSEVAERGHIIRELSNCRPLLLFVCRLRGLHNLHINSFALLRLHSHLRRGRRLTLLALGGRVIVLVVLVLALLTLNQLQVLLVEKQLVGDSVYVSLVSFSQVLTVIHKLQEVIFIWLATG